METFIAQLINGLAVGSVYALIVTGFNLLLLAGGVIQYAYPHIVVISMYTTWLTLKVSGGDLFISISATLVVAVVISIATERLFRPLTERGATMHTFIMSIAIAMILTNIMAKHLHHGMAVSFPESLASNKAVIQFGSAAITAPQIYTFFGTLILVGIFASFLHRSMKGRAFRAMAQSPFVARILGIPLRRMALLSYGFTGLLAGVSAIFLAMDLGSAYPALGDALALKIIAAALFAGIGNLYGGIICGFILGTAESFALGYLPGQWTHAVAFGMIMVVLVLRPAGLFGLRT